MGFNLKQAAVADTSFLHYKDAEGNLLWFTPSGADPETGKQPVGAELYGPGSRQHAQAQNKRQNLIFQRARKKGMKAEMSVDEEIEADARHYASLTKSMTNVDYDDGQPAVTAEHFQIVYSDRSIGFILDQTRAHLSDWENFMKSSATS